MREIWKIIKEFGIAHPSLPDLFIITFCATVTHVLLNYLSSELKIVEVILFDICAALLIFIALRVRRLPNYLAIRSESERVRLERSLEGFIAKCPRNSINRRLAIHLKDDLYRRLKVDSCYHQFESKKGNRWAAAEVYELFWRTLIDLPKTDSPLKCYAINSSSLDLWLGVDGDIFLRLQQELCSTAKPEKIRGELHRILCYEKKDFDNDTDVGKKLKLVAAKMINSGAFVYLYDVSSCQYPNHPYDKWDFLVTQGDIVESIIWESCGVGGNEVPGSPIRAICAGHSYSEAENETLKSRWDQIRHFAEELELTEDRQSVQIKSSRL
jgi:hypothetical protein